MFSRICGSLYVSCMASTFSIFLTNKGESEANEKLAVHEETKTRIMVE